ncbi:MAG: hypothetical protein JKY82_00060 [Rhizobiaceae bacterium]|nr:hypothetical protein [Rhizobiaceae bacterium]
MWKLAGLVIYLMLQIPMLIVNILPLIAGFKFGWNPVLMIALWAVWGVPFYFMMIKLDDWGYTNWVSSFAPWEN